MEPDKLNAQLSSFYYKYWLISQFELDCDVKRIIHLQSKYWWRKFKLPEYFDTPYHTNAQGIVFRRCPIPFFQQHNNQNKEAFLYINDKKITKIKFVYDSDRLYYYTIDFDLSRIMTVKLIAQKYSLKKESEQIIATVFDPEFVVDFII